MKAEPRFDPGESYLAEANRHQAALTVAQRSFSRISSLRLAAFIAAIAVFLVALNLGFAVIGTICLLLGVGVFVYLVVLHDHTKRMMDRESHLRDINQAGFARKTGKWKGFKDGGGEFSGEDHPFSGDLDVFGHASLFQWICAAETRLGRARLSESLRNPVLEEEAIARNQGIIRELAAKIDWRQDFQAAGRDVSRSSEDPESLVGWAENDSEAILTRSGVLWVRLLGLLGPVLILACTIAFRLAYLPLILIAVNALILFLYQAKCKAVVLSLCLQRRNLEAYCALLRHIETADFRDRHLLDLTAAVKNELEPSSGKIRKLQSIADWLDVRQNPFVHVVLNLSFLWDLQWLVAFQSWKKAHGKSLREWLTCIADLEALSSLAIIHFENPDWCFPSLSRDGSLSFRACNLAHPLIPPTHSVRNDFLLGDSGIVILTGSNMSGKSTLLRTIGVNLVLAYSGAPVCASALETGLFRMKTSMRLKDDLDKGLSSFYAELLRIKSIVEASRASKDILFLIDEIFRGTNSVDRIAGASEVLLQLSDLGTTGIVSTHDLELGRLEEENPGKFRNFHFAEHFVDGEIRFDYRLRSGISTTRNAMHLMRMVGIRNPASPR